MLTNKTMQQDHVLHHYQGGPRSQTIFMLDKQVLEVDRNAYIQLDSELTVLQILGFANLPLIH